MPSSFSNMNCKLKCQSESTTNRCFILWHFTSNCHLLQMLAVRDILIRISSITEASKSAGILSRHCCVTHVSFRNFIHPICIFMTVWIYIIALIKKHFALFLFVISHQSSKHAEKNREKISGISFVSSVECLVIIILFWLFAAFYCMQLLLSDIIIWCRLSIAQFFAVFEMIYEASVALRLDKPSFFCHIAPNWCLELVLL